MIFRNISLNFEIALYIEMRSARELSTLLAVSFGLLVLPLHAEYVWHNELVVDPRDTGPGIQHGGVYGFGDHEVMWKTGVENCAPSSCALYVNLAGSYGKPKNTRYRLNTAASAGYHAIGLAYSNSDAVGDLCSGETGQSAQDCQLTTRKEAILGQDLSDKITVSYNNSVVHRLRTLLEYLHSTHPTLGWDRYFDRTIADDASSIRWDLTVWAGHSQGAGTSQVLATLWGVRRVVMLAGGVYANDPDSPQLALTPSDKYFSFVHEQDSNYNGVQAVNRLILKIDRYGEIVNQDSASAPYSNTHRLTTNLPCGNAHGCVSTDDELTFGADGYPVYETVWRDIIGSPSATPSPPHSTSGGSHLRPFVW